MSLNTIATAYGDGHPDDALIMIHLTGLPEPRINSGLTINAELSLAWLGSAVTATDTGDMIRLDWPPTDMSAHFQASSRCWSETHQAYADVLPLVRELMSVPRGQAVTVAWREALLPDEGSLATAPNAVGDV